MPIDTAKRAFLRGRPQQPVTLTPPWARAFSAFIETCTRCQACVDQCPQGILRAGGGGFPHVVFANGECTFCRACLTACPAGALCADVDPPWTVSARIADTCLAHEGVYCQSCRDSCPTAAISFLLLRSLWDGVETREPCDGHSRPSLHSNPARDGSEAINNAASPLGVPQPNVDPSRCTGCGACVSVCPAGAITVGPKELIR